MHYVATNYTILSKMEAIQKEIDGLKATVATLVERVENLTTDTKSNTAAIASVEEVLEGVLSEKSAPVVASNQPTGVKGLTFTFGKEKYRLRFPTIHVSGKDVTEDELLLDETLQKTLFKENPTVFVKQ